MIYQMTAVSLSKEIQKVLMREANSSEERCGFIASKEGHTVVIHVPNVSRSPKDSFQFHEDIFIETIKTRFDEIEGIWHTHPSKASHPSDLDLLYAPFKPSRWKYWIATTDGVFQYDFPVK